jgi:hypothetical protein
MNQTTKLMLVAVLLSTSLAQVSAADKDKGLTPAQAELLAKRRSDAAERAAQFDAMFKRQAGEPVAVPAPAPAPAPREEVVVPAPEPVVVEAPKPGRRGRGVKPPVAVPAPAPAPGVGVVVPVVPAMASAADAPKRRVTRKRGAAAVVEEEDAPVVRPATRRRGGRKPAAVAAHVGDEVDEATAAAIAAALDEDEEGGAPTAEQKAAEEEATRAFLEAEGLGGGAAAHVHPQALVGGGMADPVRHVVPAVVDEAEAYQFDVEAAGGDVAQLIEQVPAETVILVLVGCNNAFLNNEELAAHFLTGQLPNLMGITFVDSTVTNAGAPEWFRDPAFRDAVAIQGLEDAPDMRGGDGRDAAALARDRQALRDAELAAQLAYGDDEGEE